MAFDLLDVCKLERSNCKNDLSTLRQKMSKLENEKTELIKVEECQVCVDPTEVPNKLLGEMELKLKDTEGDFLVCLDKLAGCTEQAEKVKVEAAQIQEAC
jgi:hypothetical protein